MREGMVNDGFQIRPATEVDVPALEELIVLSVGGLLAPFYSAAQRELALGPVFGVDRPLIRDGTYFVVEQAGRIVACGGWSRRQAAFGGDQARAGEDGLLDPTRDPARVRAFFVHPDYARRGIGRSLLEACEGAMRVAGFREAMLVATLAGEALYTACGYSVVERYEVPLAAGVGLPVARMARTLEGREHGAAGTSGS